MLSTSELVKRLEEDFPQARPIRQKDIFFAIRTQRIPSVFDEASGQYRILAQDYPLIQAFRCGVRRTIIMMVDSSHPMHGKEWMSVWAMAQALSTNERSLRRLCRERLIPDESFMFMCGSYFIDKEMMEIIGGRVKHNMAAAFDR